MDRVAMTAHATPVSGGQELAIKKMETELTKATAPGGSTMHGTPSGTRHFGDRKSTNMASNDYTSFENSPLKIDGRGGPIAMKQIIGEHYLRAAANSRDGVQKRSQSVQRNGQLAAMAKTAPQGGFFKAEKAELTPQTAFARNSPRNQLNSQMQ